MEKNRIRPVKAGKGLRMSYSRQKEVLQMPNLIEVQKNSYQWFLDEGLKEAFADISPITDYSGHLSLDFVDFTLCEDDVKYTIPECKERDATYAAPLKVKVRLHNKETDEINEHEIFMGDLPLMTETGTFVINGAERVIVSQLVRSPGIYYGIAHDKVGKTLYSCTVIPNRGAWLEYETDSNDVFSVRVDRTRKVPITVLLRALGVGTNQQIIDMFGEEPKILASLQKDPAITEREPQGSFEAGLLELYKKIRPGEPLSVESAESLITAMFFDPRRYDLAKVGRYKFNKKLALKNRINGQVLAEDVLDPSTGEVIAEAGTTVDRDLADQIQNAAVPALWIQTETRNVKVLSSMMVDIRSWIPEIEDPKAIGVTELVYYPALQQIMEENETLEERIAAIKRDIADLIPKHITKEDIFASINYNMHLEWGIGTDDDIDHLGNRRIRAVGELLQNQYRIGLSRLERVVRERMTTQDLEGISPQSLINIKPVTAAVKEFFGSSQLSQFMDQNNPLGELTHKRRLSALGPGGLSRDRAGFEVRDVHYSHYGRMCPIETPEGPNIGLINSLACYARINEYGFVEAPYRKIDKSDKDNPRVTDEVVYMTADEEDNYHVAQANEKLDEDGHFVRNSVSGRYREETQEYDKTAFDYMDVSPKMVFSVATALIPFLQNDDANRALMGSNMQRQAVPLLTTEAPVVGTGMETKTAVDSGVCVLAKEAGIVESSESNRIVVREEDGNRREYILTKFARSNQSNCYNQRPIVFKGQKVAKGEVIADGPSTSNGELALGKNPLIGFMTWEGYNYEDAVLLSERLVEYDVYTSVHIEEYEVESRDTKLGPEEITRDVPGVGDDALKDLDERGIIRVGAEVRAGDILVGKVTPKGETELTAEERLLRAIFGEKAREVRDTSLKVPHGAYGIVVDAKVFTREDGDHHLRAQERTGNGVVDDLGLCGQIGSQRLSGRLLQRPAARPRRQQRREPLRAADADRLPREVLQHGAVALLAHAGPRRLGNQRTHRHRQRLVRRQELQPSGTHQDTPAVHGQRPRRVRRPDLAADGRRHRQPDLRRIAQRLPFGLPRSVGQLGALLRQARPLGAFPLPAVAAQRRRYRQVGARTGPSLPAPGYRRTYHVQLRQPLFHRRQLRLQRLGKLLAGQTVRILSVGSGRLRDLQREVLRTGAGRDRPAQNQGLLRYRGQRQDRHGRQRAPLHLQRHGQLRQQLLFRNQTAQLLFDPNGRLAQPQRGLGRGAQTQRGRRPVAVQQAENLGRLFQRETRGHLPPTAVDPRLRRSEHPAVGEHRQDAQQRRRRFAGIPPDDRPRPASDRAR